MLLNLYQAGGVHLQTQSPLKMNNYLLLSFSLENVHTAGYQCKHMKGILYFLKQILLNTSFIAE